MSESTASAPVSLSEAKGWIDSGLDEADGAAVGQVHGLFVDAEGGEPAWLIAKLGRFGGNLVAVPLHDCAGAPGRVWSAHRRSTMRSAPVVDPTRPLLREHELTICAHYGIGERVGRAADVVGREEGSVTSRPGQ